MAGVPLVLLPAGRSLPALAAIGLLTTFMVAVAVLTRPGRAVGDGEQLPAAHAGD
ncbi:hypothetical protein KIF24_15305 [Micromonospora sp. Llam7]|uniref:hypothetical protein n=1 Tax=Micromonospora tarapacensis TaxID=2835305 RepID=UPI001C835B56|nr:hypothetical protein [Micromonospora tarapacensis]MBX7267246.1 hypothetical protein [Micromonospora tarapacensis]